MRAALSCQGKVHGETARVFQFSDNLGGKQFFRFAKKMVKNLNWALLSLAARAVLPVIYAFDNGKGQSWPSETTIAALSGLSAKTVRKGINDLLALPGFSFDWQMTSTGRKSKKFKFQTPGAQVPVFFFYKTVFLGGNWRMLTSTAKALYPVLRTFSAWDKEEAEELNDGLDPDQYQEAYVEREWEWTEISPGDAAKFAGIARSGVYAAMDDLEERCLVEEHQGGRYKVFLIPPKHYKRDFLNGELLKAFGSRTE